MANSILELLDTLPVCLIGISEHNQEPIKRPGGYPSCQFSLCTGGEGIFVDEKGKKHVINKGGAFMFRANAPHEYYPISGAWQIYFMVFNGAETDKILDYLGFGETDVMNIPSEAEYNEILEEINKMYTVNYTLNDNRFKLTSAMMYNLIVRVSDFLTNLTARAFNKKEMRLEPVLQMMNIHISENIGLPEMAKCINVSENQLGRLFNDAYGMSPMTVLKNMRMELAKHLIAWYPSRKIKDIAATVGYKDSSYFCSVFKREFKMSPEEYRKKEQGV